MKKIKSLWIIFLLFCFSGNGQVVINEVYGGGGNSGATLKNDFIELYNNGSTAVDLTGWTVQYASSAGTTWQKTALSGVIPPLGYYLIRQAQGAGGTVDLPVPNAIGSIAMSATAGKVALVNNTTMLTGSCPGGWVDFVGFGGANCFEGAGPTPVLSNTVSAQRNPIGTDSNNNKTDFITGTPSPVSSAIDLTPPSIVSLYPANLTSGIFPPFTARIQFNEPVLKGTGSIILKWSDGSVFSTIDPASVTVSGSSATFEVLTLDVNRAYYFEIPAGAFTDASSNAFPGISGNTSWSFNTIPIAGIPDHLYNFAVCGSSLPDGFIQYSVSGAQKWACSTFGYNPANAPSGNAPNGIQINGYDNGINNTNEDWLITPGFDLSGTQYPLFSFMSRTSFTGDPLQLKISADYAGYGDPYSATWTDIDGKFPVMFSDKWTLSGDINLEKFKESHVHLAFVYYSTTEDGARWTLDDILLRNSETPPPPSLLVNLSSVAFPFVAAGESGIKPVEVSAFDLVSDLTVETSLPFSVSKDGMNFSASVQFSREEANNQTLTVYIRFSPAQNRENYAGEVLLSTENASARIDLTGSSISPVTTLEVVNWNLEWFGSPALGPADDNRQQQNVLEIFSQMNADLYGLVEIVSEARLQAIVSQMPGYSYVISNYGSHTNPYDLNPGPLSDAQKMAFIYRNDIFSHVTTSALLSQGINSAEDITNPDYEYWSSGRFPFMLSADMTINCRTEPVKFILVHAKANTSPYSESYYRRKYGADDLHAWIEANCPEDKVFILGDFNDDLDRTIAPVSLTVTSWDSFTGDPADFTALTLPLSLAGKKSTTDYNDVIDHVVVSNEMGSFYLPGSAAILDEVVTMVGSYASTTSDHYPVFTRFMLPNTIAPVADVPEMIELCRSADDYYTLMPVSASDDCESPVSFRYVITGNSNRFGQSADASGFFGPGTSTITWTVSDDWDNKADYYTTVIVRENPEVTIPDGWAFNMGVDPNTVYPGYLPASSITLLAVTDDDGSYTFEWSDGSRIIGTSASITVSPTITTHYMVTVSNVFGCISKAMKTIRATDVRGGNKWDKVQVCHGNNARELTLTINPEDVIDHLMHGDYLGICHADNLNAQLKAAGVMTDHADPLRASFYPNPSAGEFNVSIGGGCAEEVIEMKVLNVLGITVDQFVHLRENSSVTFGKNYSPGLYMVTIQQGNSKIVQKLIRK